MDCPPVRGGNLPEGRATKIYKVHRSSPAGIPNPQHTTLRPGEATFVWAEGVPAGAISCIFTSFDVVLSPNMVVFMGIFCAEVVNREASSGFWRATVPSKEGDSDLGTCSRTPTTRGNASWKRYTAQPAARSTGTRSSRAAKKRRSWGPGKETGAWQLAVAFAHSVWSRSNAFRASPWIT